MDRFFKILVCTAGGVLAISLILMALTSIRILTIDFRGGLAIILIMLVILIATYITRNKDMDGK